MAIGSWGSLFYDFIGTALEKAILYFDEAAFSEHPSTRVSIFEMGEGGEDQDYMARASGTGRRIVCVDAILYVPAWLAKRLNLGDERTCIFVPGVAQTYMDSGEVL